MIFIHTHTHTQTHKHTHTHAHHIHTLQPHAYSTPSHSSSIMSGSPTNTMKPAISEASTTLTGGAIPLSGYPNAAMHGHHLPHANTDQLEVMTSSLTNNNNQRQAASGVGGSRPPTGGGNPMVNYPQLPAVNVAPPLHSPGEYQYRFVQVPAFPRPNNNKQQHRLGNQSQSTVSGVSSQRNHITATEQFTNLNHRNSRELAQQRAPAMPTSVQYHLESTV